MSMTDERSTTGSDSAVPAARAVRRDLFSDELLDQLMSRVDEDGVALTGDGGFLPELIKAVLERGMDAELTSHLGYERGDRGGHGSGNSRNGTTPKTVGTEIGDIGLDQPRDRNSTFASALVPKGARRMGGLEDMIISLYAGGMTIRDIQHHLVSTLGTELSHETISKVTEAVAEEVTAWQSRPLEAFYPVIFLDALVVKVRDGAHVANRAAHLAVGVDTDGVKHVLGIWIQATEGAKFWAGVCSQLANRGVKDVLIVCCDGLTGFPEAVQATWATATVQTSSIDTGWWRDGLAGHRTMGGGPMQTCAFEALTQTSSLPVEAGRVVASGSRASSAVMRFQHGRPVGDRVRRDVANAGFLTGRREHADRAVRRGGLGQLTPSAVPAGRCRSGR